MSNSTTRLAARGQNAVKARIYVYNTTTGQPVTGLTIGSFASYLKSFDSGSFAAFAPAAVTEIGVGGYDITLDAPLPNNFNYATVRATHASHQITDSDILWDGKLWRGLPTAVAGTNPATVTFPAAYVPVVGNYVTVESGPGLNSSRYIDSVAGQIATLSSVIPGMDVTSTISIGEGDPRTAAALAKAETRVDSNVQQIIGVPITGSGTENDPWGP